MPVNAGVWINLGPTGVQAWVYRGIEGGPTADTGLSRQFQVKTIDAGSPAAGILAVDDVILGANGTGAAPVPFTSDARKSFGYAIGDAEARNPATLKLLVWRAGTTSTMTLTLRTMGAYSATAPFNCPKSAKILDEGLDYIMANEDAGYAGISALALMAADNPAYPNNAARQTRAQTYALGKMLPPGLIQYIKDGNVELGCENRLGSRAALGRARRVLSQDRRRAGAAEHRGHRAVDRPWPGGQSLLKGVNATDGTGIGETVISGSGNAVLGVSDALNTTANLTIGPNVGGTDIGTFNQTVNALIGNGTVVTNNTRTVSNTVAGTRTLTVGNGGGTGIFNGQINAGTGNIQLIKTGVGNQTLNDTNSYTGGTRIDGGILTLGHATNTLADAGAVNVNGGTLDLGTNTDTVGAVTLTSGSITGTGAAALTGSAYDVRSGTVSAKLGGLVGLTKTTAGTVTLSGGNTYSGATAVNDGTLLVNGNQSIASGNVTVAANATLGGTGTMGGDTTIAAGGKLEFNLSTIAASHDPLDMSSGKTLTFSGASVLTITSSGGASPGIYTLVTGGNNISGVAPATLNLPVGWAATVSISGNNLLLNLTSTGGHGPVDQFTISSIPSTQTVGTPITGITLTAKDAANATVTSFTGTVTFGGTGGFTGTSASFIDGVLTSVSVTPTVAGSNLTFTVDNGAGKTGSATIATINPAPSAYETWAVGGVAFDADTNGDGVKNGLAWLLGAGNATGNASGLLPKASINGGNLRLTFRCLKSTARGGVVLKVQTSGDLGASDPWTSHEAAVPDADSTVGGVIFDTTADADPAYINVIADIPAAGARVFGRLVAIP